MVVSTYPDSGFGLQLLLHDGLEADLKRIVQSLVTLGFVAGMMASSPAFGHAIWFAERSSRLALIYGMGTDDLDTTKRASLVTLANGYDANWKPVKTQLQQEGPLVVVHSGQSIAAVTAVLFNGTWSKPPGNGEWAKKNRLEMPDAVISEKNYKYAVHLISPLKSPLPKFRDQVLQIMPLTSSLPVQKGASLKLQILFHGKPIAGAHVLPDYVNDVDGASQVTGPDGKVSIHIRDQGLNVINAVFDGPPDDPKKVDRIEYEATLSFVLPHKPE